MRLLRHSRHSRAACERAGRTARGRGRAAGRGRGAGAGLGLTGLGALRGRPLRPAAARAPFGNARRGGGH